MTKTDMSGDTPKMVWSINLKSMQFYMALVAGVASFFGLVWGGVIVAEGWMYTKSEHHIQDTISNEVLPPGGKIYKATQEQIDDERQKVMTKIDTDVSKRINTLEKQINYNTLLLQIVVEETSGRKPPPVPQ